MCKPTFTLRQFCEDESGSPTVEFVLIAPVFMMLFFWIIETGFMTFHAIQLDRGVEVVVRELMLDDILDGRTGAEAHDFLKAKICENAIVSNCLRDVKLEVGSATTTQGSLDTEFECNDRLAAQIDPLYEESYRINAGECDAGDADVRPVIMFFRACLIVDPVLPAGLAMPWEKDATGGVQLRSSSAFVNEPC